MSLKQFLNSERGQFTPLLINAFNIAAICALGLWHGYLFRVEHAAPAPLELKLAGEATCAPCVRALAPHSYSQAQNRQKNLPSTPSRSTQ
jgi:hypothetical protein